MRVPDTPLIDFLFFNFKLLLKHHMQMNVRRVMHREDTTGLFSCLSFQIILEKKLNGMDLNHPFETRWWEVQPQALDGVIVAYQCP